MAIKEVNQETVVHDAGEVESKSLTEQVVKYNINLWIMALPVMACLTVLSFLFPFFSLFFFIKVFGVYLFGANLLFWLLFAEENTKEIATFIRNKVKSIIQLKK